jgi:hypothetical protein
LHGGINEGSTTYFEALLAELAGVNGTVDVEGNSYRVGLSLAYCRAKTSSGISKVVASSSEDDDPVTRCEVLNGSGFRRTLVDGDE